MKKIISYFLLLTLISCCTSNIQTHVYAKELTSESSVKKIWSKTNKPEFYGTTSIVIKKGEKFSLDNTMYRIFARDFEDFDVSNKIEVTSNNVNTCEVGDYKVNYSVTDSDGNTSTLEVPVKVVDGENTKNIIERTIYSLPSVDNIHSMGIARGDNHDRQMLGIFVKANSTIRIRKISGDTNLTYTMLNNNSCTEASETITSDWKDITFKNDYTPFIKTLYKQDTPVKVEIEWNSSNLGIKELNYYHYGDNEKHFFDKWKNDTNSYSVIDGEALTVLVPYGDHNKLVNYYQKGFKTLNDFLDYWKKVVDKYDYMLGLEYNPDNVNDQNVKSKFFVKANANGAGAAYYASDHVGINNPSVATFFEVNWGGLHEFGHGYQGSLGKGELGIGEVSNNIFAHYIQIDKNIYPYNDDWLGKLINIEERYNKVRVDGKTFMDLDSKGKLYFIINVLDSLEGAETYRKIAKLYRHNVILGKNMSTQDAWALGIYDSYEYNVIDYFDAWGIKVSDSVKQKIENSNAVNIFSVKDLVINQDLTNKIKNDLNLSGFYNLVSNNKLKKYKLYGNLNINVNIDNKELLNGKDVILKNCNNELYRRKINDSKIEFENIPIGVYQLILPDFLGSYTNNSSNIAIHNSNVTKKDITYINVENKIYFDNDVKVQFQGYYYNDAAEIKLLNDAITNNLNVSNNLKLHFRYRGTTLFNSRLPKDCEYAKIQVLDNNNNEVYVKKVGGKKEMFSNINVETKEIPVEIGYKLVLKYGNAKDKLKFISTLNSDYRAAYQIDSNTDATFIVTQYGLKPNNMTDEKFYDEYVERLKKYIANFEDSVKPDEINNKSLYKTEKSIIVRGYKKMNAVDKAQYKKLYDDIIN